jgi:riboflavin biosynthesis pyrimidine reductase
VNFRVGNALFTSLSPAGRRSRGPGRGHRGPGHPWHHPCVHVIHPHPDEVGVDELYGVRRGRSTERPWVGLVMITSLDGSTVVDGRSGGLGNPTDSSILGALRRAADVVLVGASTAATEHYGPPKQAGLRIGVVTSRASIDPGTELFTSGAGFLVMPEDGPPDPPGIDVVRAGRGRVDALAAVSRLGTVTDEPTFVLVEGGPRLNGAFLDGDCVDELDLTHSPVLVGGDGGRVVTGAGPTFDRYDLVHLATEDGYLYGRWVRRPYVG